MLRRESKLLGVMSVGVCMSIMAMANGFRNPPEGASALGHAGGKMVLTEDASAVSHNPANLTQLKDPQAMGSVTIVNTETDFSSPFGAASTDDAWKFLPSVFGAVPLEDKNYVIGVGFTTPYGQSTVWDKNGVFRYTAPYSVEMTLIDVNPALAVKLNEKLSVAAGLDVFWSRLDIKQVLPWSALTGSALSPDGRVHLQGDGEGVGANAAITFRPAKGHALALTYRSPVKVDYEGDCDLSEFPMGAQALGLSPSSDFDTSIEFPAIIAFGYGVDLSETVRVEADVEWVEFSRYDDLELDAGNNNVLLNQPGSPNPFAPVSVRQDWDDTWTFGLGADWKATKDLTLRAGYIFLQSPVPEETLAPTLPDADRHVFTVGAGIKRGPQSLDLAYGYSLIGDRDVDGNQNPAYNGTYETSSHLMSVSYGYNF